MADAETMPTPAAAEMTIQTETLETLQARHRKEQRDLQSRITQKKKNATKKTRKGVNDECANLERDLADRQKGEVDALLGGGKNEDEVEEEEQSVTEEERGDNVDRVTEKIKSVTFDTPTPPSEREPTQEGGGGGGGGGKKRNRQKERLARRAAEAEAAAVAAESEAANMTDHRANEKEYIHAQFKTHGLVEKDIQPDGHCLFSAVADQLVSRGYGITPNGKDEDGEKEPGYKITRRVATSYMLAHRDDFEPFLELDDGFDSYIEKMRDTAIWGGQMELVALANVYGIEIKVVQDGRTESIDPTGEEKKTEGDRRRIWLAYYRHGYGLGEHYNSLRKA